MRSGLNRLSLAGMVPEGALDCVEIPLQVVPWQVVIASAENAFIAEAKQGLSAHAEVLRQHAR